MPDPSTIPFYDLYEAHLFAHQMEEEGHRASVYHHGFGYFPWIAGGFRVVVFEDGLTGDPDDQTGEVPQFGEFPTEPIGRAFDDFVRVVTVAGVAICVCQFVIGLVVLIRLVFHNHHTIDSDAIFRFISATPLMVVLLFAGFYLSITAYEGYRREEPFWVAVFYLIGCLALVFVFLL